MPGAAVEFVEIEVDGTRLETEPGISVAAALIRAGMSHLRDSPQGHPRGAFCMMGICQECLIRINNTPAQACMTPVTENMSIKTGCSL